MHETSGVLQPVVRAYLNGEPLDDEGLAIMRAYLAQWVEADAFIGPDVAELRSRVRAITTNTALRVWLADAFDAGIDPL